MSATLKSPALESVTQPARAGTLLHPMRLEILARAHEATSSTELAAALGQTRQKVHYHVTELARAGFLRKAGRRRKRNMVEQRWIASARSYVLSPAVLGPAAPDPRRVEDAMSSAYLLAALARSQAELGRARAEAAEQDKRISTLSIDAEIAFEDPAQRERFALALRDAVARVVAEHSTPVPETPSIDSAADSAADSDRPRPRPVRLVVGCHPIPPEASYPQTTSPYGEGDEQ